MKNVTQQSMTHYLLNSVNNSMTVCDT